MLLFVAVSFFVDIVLSFNVHTNCIGLDDGYYDIQVVPDEIINIKCSNEYMIIDISHDNGWYNLLSSYKHYHEYIIGPILNDHVNWDNFLPNIDAQHYLVSPDCNTCDDQLDINNDLFQDSTAYYMNQIANGCFHKNRGLPACDMDPITYQCKICDWVEGTVISRSYQSTDDYLDDGNTGICGFTVKPNDFVVATQFNQCFNYQYTAFKPSLGSNGQFCQCIKTDEENVITTIPDLDIVPNTIKGEEDVVIKTPETNTVYLHQSDFDYGTYRITEGGTYIIMQDIEYDFNSNIDSPNAEGAYMPRVDQADTYPGAGTTAGPYFLGFFSGITIETSDGVVLDLNGYTLSMSKGLFFQQGFFSIIELGSQPFLPMHGPGNFGSQPKWGSNIIIKNGIIGRSSHHGIHGNNNQNILIEDISVNMFVTHGIQLNGFEDVIIRNVDIGPSNNMVKLNGNYIQMRALLNNMRQLYKKDEIKDIKFSFKGREDDKLTFKELIEDRLIVAMDQAFKSAVYDEYDIEDPSIAEIVDNVFNNHGSNQIPYGAVVYGLFLNYPASGIFGWHVSELTSTNCVLENIHVHDLYHHSEEMVGLTTNKHGISHALNGPLSGISLVGSDMMETISSIISFGEGTFKADYVGDLVTDVHFAYYKFAYNDWDYWPGTPYYGDNGELIEWAFGNPKYDNIISSERIDDLDTLVTCNGDRMQHPLKGIVGIKITGVENVQFRGDYIRVTNLHDSSELGSTLCGDYSKANFGQQLPYSTGFSGNMIHAMDITFSDVDIDVETLRIKNVVSDTGLAYGISTWYNSNIVFNGDTKIQIKNIVAGDKYLDNTEIENNELFVSPNHYPQACGIRKHDNDNYPINIKFKDTSIFNQQCIYGIVGCDDNYGSAKTHIGKIVNENCNQIIFPYEINEIKDIQSKSKNNAIIIGPDLSSKFQNINYSTVVGLAISILVICGFIIYNCCLKVYNNNNNIKNVKKRKKKRYDVYGTF